MKHDVRKYLTDVREAIDLIRIRVAGIVDLESYKANVTVKDAVVRRLTIIGEALYQIRKTDKNIVVNHKENIIGLRHISCTRLRHRRGQIDLERCHNAFGTAPH